MMSPHSIFMCSTASSTYTHTKREARQVERGRAEELRSRLPSRHRAAPAGRRPGSQAMHAHKQTHAGRGDALHAVHPAGVKLGIINHHRGARAVCCSRGRVGQQRCLSRPGNGGPRCNQSKPGPGAAQVMGSAPHSPAHLGPCRAACPARAWVPQMLPPPRRPPARSHWPAAQAAAWPARWVA